MGIKRNCADSSLLFLSSYATCTTHAKLAEYFKPDFTCDTSNVSTAMRNLREVKTIADAGKSTGHFESPISTPGVISKLTSPRERRGYIRLRLVCQLQTLGIDSPRNLSLLGQPFRYEQETDEVRWMAFFMNM